jgi:mono/diheme cytochrome c family protein
MLFSSAWSRSCLLFFSASVVVFLMMTSTVRSNSGQYVGSEACADCHESEYENYKKFSKKAKSGHSVKVMANDLTKAELEECFVCHATGFGKPGGFVSFEATPELADAGCEVCHGPGYDHVESGGDSELIQGKLQVSDCEHCHNPERVAAFDFKPLLYGGAH